MGGQRRNRIVGVGPDETGQIVKGNADSPPVRRRDDEHHAEQSDRNQPEHPMRPPESEIDQRDDDGDRDAVADDRERPGVAGVTLEHESAGTASLEMMRPAGEQRALAAVRTPAARAAANRGDDLGGARHVSATRRRSAYPTLINVMSKTIVAFGGIALPAPLLP